MNALFIYFSFFFVHFEVIDLNIAELMNEQ